MYEPFNNFTYIGKQWDWTTVAATGMIIFLKNWNWFAVFRMAGKIPVENDKLAISDTGLLRGVWKNFSISIGMLEGPEDLSFFQVLYLR